MTDYVKPPQNKPVLIPDPDARRDVAESGELTQDEAKERNSEGESLQTLTRERDPLPRGRFAADQDNPASEGPRR